MRVWLGLMLLALGCAPSREVAFNVTLDPHGKTPLAAVATLEAAEPLTVTAVEIEGGVSSDVTALPPARAHTIAILGFYPNTSHRVRLRYKRGQQGAEETTPAVTVKTKPLPDDFPIIDVIHGPPQIPSEGGYLLASLSPLEQGNPLDQKGLAVLVDTRGRVLWYMATRSGIGPMGLSRDGNLLFQQFKSLRQDEISWDGQTLRSWQSNGLRQVEQGSVPVALDSIHHDYQETDEGGFWTLSSRIREQGELRRVDELLVRFAPDGVVKSTISLMDALDPEREIHPRYPNYWELFYGRGVIDWGHANSLLIKGSTALISLAYQNAVVKLQLANGKPLWILGDPQGWKPPLSDLLLRPHGKLRWPVKQHSATLTTTGNVLLFDNGATRSRAVEYKVDEAKRTVEQVWEFTDTKPFHSPLLGAARELPKTGNIQITDGSRTANRAGFWCRVLEVTHQMPPRKVLELAFRRRQGAGVSLYRCERLTTLPFTEVAP